MFWCVSPCYGPASGLHPEGRGFESLTAHHPTGAAMLQQCPLTYEKVRGGRSFRGFRGVFPSSMRSDRVRQCLVTSGEFVGRYSIPYQRSRAGDQHAIDRHHLPEL